jgi:carbon-monoxide dehydrogenase large subunit
MPFRTGLVFTYDCGEFERNMDLALKAADWAGFPERRAVAGKRAMLRGIGVANAIEIAAGPFRKPGDEMAEVRFDAAGDATIVLGSHNHGQGHETAFRQIAASLLGTPPERIRVLFGDTDLLPHGRGTFGSRSMTAGGAALVRASERLIERGRSLAAHRLETSEKDVHFENGWFRVVGTDRAVSIGDIARLSHQAGSLPPGTDYGFGERALVSPGDANFPNGCHVCEVEIDPQTGMTKVVRYTVCDDVGALINPMLVKGQLHGGVAQGLGQVFSERIVYGDTGQMLTASFMDYGMPRADDMPMVDVLSNPVPTLTNPLGVKGAGEAGAVGALSAIVNAIIDALSPYGVRHFDMPATPERIWAVINGSTKRPASQ